MGPTAKKKPLFWISFMILNLKLTTRKAKKISLTFLIFALLFVVLTSSVAAEEYLGVVLGVKDKAEGQAVGKNRVTIGNVESVTGNKVVLEEKKTKQKTEVVLDEETKLIGKNKRLLNLDQIKLKDKIAIISSESAELATAGGKIRKTIRVFVRQESQAQEGKRRAVQGIISNLEGNQITLVHQIHQDRVYQLSFNSQTVIKIKGVANATAANLEVGQRMVAVGSLDENGLIVAKKIHVIPGQATGVFEKVTPTATPTAVLTPSP